MNCAHPVGVSCGIRPFNVRHSSEEVRQTGKAFRVDRSWDTGGQHGSILPGGGFPRLPEALESRSTLAISPDFRIGLRS
jgi:hypothetical protein